MQEPIQKVIGRKIREAREVAGKTQKEIGDLLGYSAMGVSHFENGARELKFSDIEKLAKYFQRDLSFFLASASDITFFRAKPTDDPGVAKSLKEFDSLVDSLG
jgi:transcriptional regulator with XRE-family HTH domain